jgi:hypothetical protein
MRSLHLAISPLLMRPAPLKPVASASSSAECPLWAGSECCRSLLPTLLEVYSEDFNPRTRGGDLVWRLPNSRQLFYHRYGPRCFISVCSTIQICSFMPSYLLRLRRDQTTHQVLRLRRSRFRDFLMSASKLLPLFHWRIVIQRSKNLIWINIHATNGDWA